MTSSTGKPPTPASAGVLLHVDQVHSGYGKNEVINGMDLDVPEGHIACLLGANGTGKSTLLKTILGLVECRRGQIWFRDERIETWPIHHRVAAGIRYVPQGHAVFERMSVLENLLLGAYLKPDPAQVNARLSEVTALFPALETLLYRQAGVLSGGERQMVAVGRALMVPAALLVLDEPSAGLSPKYVRLLFEALSRAKAKGLTMLLCEQNAAKALEVGDYVYVLEHGRVIDQGSAAQLRNDPAFRSTYLGQGAEGSEDRG